MKKKQNTRRNIAECIHKIYRYGMFVTAGFIVGFDTEKVSMGQAMIDFIEETDIPVCMVGLLYALPGTQLTRRLAEKAACTKAIPHEGRAAGDQCTLGCNFDTKRPLRDILVDYKPCFGTCSARRHMPDGCQGSLSSSTAPAAAATCRMATCARGLAVSTAYTASCGPCRSSRAVLEDLRRGRQDQSRRAALHCDADGAVHAPRAVLEARDQ